MLSESIQRPPYRAAAAVRHAVVQACSSRLGHCEREELPAHLGICTCPPPLLILLLPLWRGTGHQRGLNLYSKTD